MGKLKPAGYALWEIYMNHGFPALQAFPDFVKAMHKLADDLKENREIDPDILIGAGQILNVYFEIERGPLWGQIVQYKDQAGNVYHEGWECLQSLLDGSYNKMTGEENG